MMAFPLKDKIKLTLLTFMQKTLLLKIIASILFTLTLFLAKAQFEPLKHFVLSSLERSIDDCSFELDCECCWEDLLLFDNGHFYQLNKCGNGKLCFGTYALKEGAYELEYSQHFISNIPAEKKDPPNFISNRICMLDSIRKESERFLISACESGQKIISQDERSIGFESKEDSEHFEDANEVYKHLFDLAYCKWLGENDWQKEYPNYTLEDGHAFAKKAFDILDCNMDYYIEGSEVFDHLSIGGYHNYTIRYAPDSAFRIFTFIGEDCGAHCNGMYSNLVQFENTTWDKYRDAQVDTILPFTDSLYIIHSTAQWTGTMGGTSKGFKIVKNGVDNLVPIQITPVITDSTSMLSKYFGSPYESYEFRIYNHWSAPDLVLNTTVLHSGVNVNYEYMFDYSFYESLEHKIPPKIYARYSKSGGSLHLNVKGDFTIANGGIVDFKEEYELLKESDFIRN